MIEMAKDAPVQEEVDFLGIRWTKRSKIAFYLAVATTAIILMILFSTLPHLVSP